VIPPFEFDRSFDFEVPPEALWRSLTSVDRFPSWWPWLREFDTAGRGIEPGIEAACVVRGPLPYALRFTVAVDRVEVGRAIDTTVTGDIEGPARLEVGPHGAGSSARLVWKVHVVDPALRATARVARPLMEWGHNWVVSRGVASFRVRALDVS